MIFITAKAHSSHSFYIVTALKDIPALTASEALRVLIVPKAFITLTAQCTITALTAPEAIRALIYLKALTAF